MSEVTGDSTSDWTSLIRQARDGNDSALGLIVSRLRNYLLLVANTQIQPSIRSKFCGSDIIQQSMLEAHQAIGSFRGTTESELKAWLKKIVISNLVDETRRYQQTRKRDTSREIPVDWHAQPLPQPNGQTASWMLRKNEFDQQLFVAIQELPARQRHVIEARHRDAMPYSQIAIELDISEEAARKLWSRGVDSLKRTLSKSAADNQ